MIDKIKTAINIIINIAIIAVLILLIYKVFFYMPENSNNSAEEQQQTIPYIITGNGETKTETKTEIVYVPKETVKYITIDDTTGKEIETEYTEKTDIEVATGKPSVNVKLNDKEVEIQKDNNENYVFEKNKLQLTQSSQVDFNIHVDPIEVDNTKHWGIGAGYGNNGLAAIVEFPINKKNNVDGWIMKDRDTTAAGVMIKF